MTLSTETLNLFLLVSIFRCVAVPFLISILFTKVLLNTFSELNLSSGNQVLYEEFILSSK